jgi:xanthine/CO dehydrogenase XdhC/CoxF family maturation factor
MREIEASLPQIRDAWMSGRSALDHCPAAWRGVVEGDDAEGALAALAGHAMQALFRATPPAPIEPRALLPKLAAPTLPEALRPRVRRLLTTPKARGLIERALIDFVAARGYAMHPFDWAPSPRDDWAPDLYAPWLDWARGEEKPLPPPVLRLDTYDQWSFAMRRVELVALRASDPDAARAVIVAKANSEPAERRAQLIESLETNLSEKDAAFLESQMNDRSERVQILARFYLSRLNRPAEADALATELAETLEVGKMGLLRRVPRLTIKTLKSAPQNLRRRELFRLATFAGLARALGVVEDDLIASTPAGAPDDLTAFAQMVAATGSDRACRALFDLILEDNDFPLAHVRPLALRLGAQERRALLPRILKRDGESLETTLTLMGRELGRAPLSAVLASPSYAALMSAIEIARDEDPTKRWQAEAALEATLFRIGVLAEASAAAELIQRLIAAGLSTADPKLESLRLNAALIEGGRA